MGSEDPGGWLGPWDSRKGPCEQTAAPRFFGYGRQASAGAGLLPRDPLPKSQDARAMRTLKDCAPHTFIERFPHHLHPLPVARPRPARHHLPLTCRSLGTQQALGNGREVTTADPAAETLGI